MKEYTDLEIMQMIGRAVNTASHLFTLLLTSAKGRPQFGKLPQNLVLQCDPDFTLGR